MVDYFLQQTAQGPPANPMADPVPWTAASHVSKLLLDLKVVPAILSQLSKREPAAMASAAMALSRVALERRGSEQAAEGAPLLMEALTNYDGGVRAAAAQAIGAVGSASEIGWIAVRDLDGVQYMIDRLKADEEVSVRIATSTSLAQLITGVSARKLSGTTGKFEAGVAALRFINAAHGEGGGNANAGRPKRGVSFAEEVETGDDELEETYHDDFKVEVLPGTSVAIQCLIVCVRDDLPQVRESSAAAVGQIFFPDPRDGWIVAVITAHLGSLRYKHGKKFAAADAAFKQAKARATPGKARRLGALCTRAVDCFFESKVTAF